MSAYVLTSAQLVLGSLDISIDSAKFDIAGSVAMQDRTTFGTGGFVAKLPGLESWMFGVDGFADYASGAISTTFDPTQIGSQQVLSIMPTNVAPSAGDPTIFTRGRLASLKQPTGNVGTLAGFSLSVESDTAGTPGVVLAPMASRGTSFTGSAVAYTGPKAGQSIYGALQVSAAAGTNLVVKIQSDDNSGFTSPTDRITFSTMSAVGWAWGTPVPGDLSTETYWRATATASSGTFSFHVLCGVT